MDTDQTFILPAHTTIKTTGFGEIYVSFFAANAESSFARVSVFIEDGYVKMGSSTCLPTSNFGPDLEVYLRLHEFIKANNLKIYGEKG